MRAQSRSGHSSVAVVRAEPEHAQALQTRLRLADRNELFAAYGMTPSHAVQHSLARSSRAWAVLQAGRPIALFGVGEWTPAIGCPWLLGTDELEACARMVVRNSRPYIERMLVHYPCLMNWVDARNARSVRWLRWCGFQVEAARPFGLLRLPFHLFHMGGSSCVLL